MDVLVCCIIGKRAAQKPGSGSGSQTEILKTSIAVHYPILVTEIKERKRRQPESEEAEKDNRKQQQQQQEKKQKTWENVACVTQKREREKRTRDQKEGDNNPF